MNQQELIEFIPSLIRGIVILFTTLFALGAREAYNYTTTENYKFEKVIAKIVLGLYVVVVVLNIAENIVYVKNAFPISVMVIAFAYDKFAKWIFDDVVEVFRTIIKNRIK